MSGSYFIVESSNFLLINATAVTLAQGHGNVIKAFSQTYLHFVPNM